MTVQKISLTCWIVFGVMCLAFLPLGAGILAIHALPTVTRVVLAVVVAGGLWWGPFAYGMYLSMAAVKNGDRRLLKRGKAGTAVVLEHGSVAYLGRADGALAAVEQVMSARGERAEVGTTVGVAPSGPDPSARNEVSTRRRRLLRRGRSAGTSTPVPEGEEQP